MLYLSQSGNSQIVLIGPFVSGVDGTSLATGLTIANTDIKLNKHSSSSFTNKNSGGATHLQNGYYHTTLNYSDCDSRGRLVLTVAPVGVLPVWHEYTVLESGIYNAWFEGGLNSFADALLKRDLSVLSGEASRSVLNALRFLRNKWTVISDTLTVYKEDDSTSAWTATLSTNSNAAPITASDPG
jgi:hypothetical protein